MSSRPVPHKLWRTDDRASRRWAELFDQDGGERLLGVLEKSEDVNSWKVSTCSGWPGASAPSTPALDRLALFATSQLRWNQLFVSVTCRKQSPPFPSHLST